MPFLCALLALCGPLATEPLPGGGRLVLDTIRDGSGAGPCLVIRGLPLGPRGCARAPSERAPAMRRPISAGPIVRASRHAPVELFGETGPRTRLVVVRYTGPWRGERMSYATLLRIADPFALAAAGIRRPFGVFYACIPGSARRAWADALTGRGYRLGTADFSRLLAGRHPQRNFMLFSAPAASSLSDSGASRPISTCA
jgi:hypothetical protein